MVTRSRSPKVSRRALNTALQRLTEEAAGLRFSIQSWKAPHAVKPDGFTFEGIVVLGSTAGNFSGLLSCL
jgi:hypothetical protein